MIHEHDRKRSDESELEAMLAFDRTLADGGILTANVGEWPDLVAVHECQRLLEAVWPRAMSPAVEFPRRFGRYLILRELGQGAFGVVFLAADSVLGRKVALKVPRPHTLVTPEIRRRFVREAEAASRLDHPHIVPVYDVGLEGPICYIASAYCEGLTLADWLRRQSAPVPFVEAARLVAILSAAVGHAHQRGILHRDLKPGNILLQRRDPSVSGNEDVCSGMGYIPRICDFGLAKLLDQDSHDTCSGMPIGSPTYMAPEQAAGRLRDHGPATDVYALGVILYELLTGKPPLRGETDLETLRLVSDQDPPAPRGLRPGLPRDLETICLKCLEKRPKERYDSAAELAEDLQRYLTGKPVHARPVRAWQHAGKWAKRRPVHAALAAVTALAISVVLGVVFWSGARVRQHKQNLSEAVAQTTREVRELERSAHGAQIELAVAVERERFANGDWAATQIKRVHDIFVAGDVVMAARMLETLGPSRDLSERKGFAWGYLRQLFKPEVTLLGAPNHSDFSSIMKLAISPDGRILAAGMADGRVVLWDLNENRVLRTHVNDSPGPGAEVYRLAFSSDGRFLAAGSTSRSVRLWDVNTGDELGALPVGPKDMVPEFGELFTLNFTDGSDCLVTFRTGVTPKTFYFSFWSVPKPGGQPAHLATLKQDQIPKYTDKTRFEGRVGVRHEAEAFPWQSYARDHLVLLDDGKSLAIHDEPSGVTLYNQSGLIVARACRPLGIPAINQRPFTAYLPDEIAWWSDRARRLGGWAASGDRRLLAPCGIPDFSSDGRTLALFHWPLGSILKDVASGRILCADATDPTWRVADFAHSPDGRFLVMAGFHPQIHLWRLKPCELAAHEKEVWSLAFSPDGTSLASAADDHTVKLWDIANARERATLKGHGSLVTAVAFSPDGKVLASASFDKTIRLADATTGEQLATLRGHADRVRALAFSPDGATLATAGEDLGIRLWDVAHRRELASPLTGHADWVFSMAFTRDGKTLFSGSIDKTIRCWDWRTGRCRTVWQAEDQVYSLALSPDGQTLAAAHHGGTIALWDVEGEKRRGLLRGHSGEVLRLAFSPDGLTLASTGNDRAVRIWDPATTQQLLTLQGHDAAVHAVAFSPDGTLLATGSHDGKIKLWRASRDDQASGKKNGVPSAQEREIHSEARSPQSQPRNTSTESGPSA
jgi:eukaryotic-like serine/threonine-protein kinase